METLKNNKVVLHLSSLSTGGAAMWTMDFHRKCLDFGYESYVVIRGRTCIYPDGSRKEIKPTKRFLWNKGRRYLFRQVVKHSKIDNAYSMYNLCERFTCHSAEDVLKALPKKPDVIVVHWVSDFANAKVIRDLETMTKAKIVFHMNDHALYSGGCHYQLDCQSYKNGCHDCPATNSWIVRCGIEKNYVFKKKYLPKSCYIDAEEADRVRLRQSDIYKDFRFERIVFPYDEEKFCPPTNRMELRRRWGIAKGQKVVFAGASHIDEPRKGMAILLEAIQLIKNEDVLVVLAGNIGKAEWQFPIEKIRLLGVLDEKKLIEAYQMSDMFVCPSLADAGPMMVQQAIMCGTPVVAFPVGYSVGLVETGVTGYLAKYGDAHDLAQGIDRITSLSDADWEMMSKNCREKALHTYSNQVKGNTIEDVINRICN